MVFVKYIWLLSNIFQLIENKIPDWKINILIGKICLNLKTCMLTEIACDRKSAE